MREKRPADRSVPARIASAGRSLEAPPGFEAADRLRRAGAIEHPVAVRARPEDVDPRDRGEPGAGAVTRRCEVAEPTP